MSDRLRHLTFNGRVGGHKLTPGRDQLTAILTVNAKPAPHAVFAIAR